MIPVSEIQELRGEWSLRDDVVEKDYALGWILAAIAADDELSRSWIFKGGTALRKCFYETYRFSEDLDFTVINGGPEEPEALRERFVRIADWLESNAGLTITLDEKSFVRKKNRRGNPTTLGRIAFSGPRRPPQLPKVKLDLTSDEVVPHQPILSQIFHPYSDQPLPVNGVLTYSIEDLFAEKLRALAERCRPRDLYDVIHLHRHPDLIGQNALVWNALEAKCAHAGIQAPDLQAIQHSPFQGELEQEWGNMLAHQLPSLPPFSEFWDALGAVFDWLSGSTPATSALPRAGFGDLDDTWRPPIPMATWRQGAPMELIRFAGSNRLKVEIDYRAKDGRVGPRLVEPYSLRRSRTGHLLLFVVNDHNELRSYRVDRVAGVRVTQEPFKPSYVVEF